ncbi:hypothetical protein NKR23_g4719 [Pleurostoma richardsiae]|uniref:NAD dependent epimerase/dehydratase n=1 Tax=Pleurostoma richardsiae TaxID=41990 RepID=A0AA38RUZ7_9PEZI|nr:hypothetical protein NKR23_g4719 [Pleurostoma richardsiae]
MGQVNSAPQPGTSFQVIGAGLPRTGTASVAAALEILLQGPVYHGATDIPACLFVPELLKVYPEAKVICTVRDPEDWVRSIGNVADNSLQWILKILLLPLPTMRMFPAYLHALENGRYNELLKCPGGQMRPVRESWDNHQEWLRKNVPKEKLVFFDVRDGWGPLCEALDCKVPEGIPFPKINESANIDEFAKKTIQNALLSWAVIIGTVVVTAGLWIRFRN